VNKKYHYILSLPMFVFILGCGETSLDGVVYDHQPTQTQQAKLEDDGADCNITKDPSPVQMQWTNAPEMGAVLSVDGTQTFTFDILNTSTTDGIAYLSVYIFSEYGRIDREVISAYVFSQSSTQASVQVSDLFLPTHALQTSGLLGFVLRFEGSDGTTYNTLRHVWHFHPNVSGGGWVIYDDQARDQQFDAGALTLQTKLFHTQAQQDAPPPFYDERGTFIKLDPPTLSTTYSEEK
jgi:hypothetical protein